MKKPNTLSNNKVSWAILAILSLALSACANKNNDNVVIKKSQETHIYHHGGGVISEIYQETAKMKRPIKIKGFCGSSCTLALRFPDTCIAKESQIMFHAAKDNRTKTINVTGTFFLINNMPKKLRNFLKRKLLPKGVFTKNMNRRDFYYKGTYLIDKFDLKPCSSLV